jgi:exodeoxyribonuclease VII large subunit
MDEVNFVIRSSFDQSYWVVAELANVSTSPRGHMYMELVEKSGNQIIAKARANLWSSRRGQIVAAFEDVTRQSIQTGMKLLLQLSVNFHNVYGLGFQVLDIDPAYSLGELKRQKQETIKRLNEEGLLDFNKQYVLAPALQNIAIISSETAAGYQDFMNQLTSNKHGFTFNTQLFPALMQGEQAVASIIAALDASEQTKIDFDAVVIIRGGGSNLDLACFDDYTLNARLAQSYFPLLSGIGHERDQSVTDMIAHTRLKTPTAVAEFIINHNFEFENTIIGLFDQIFQTTRDRIDEEKYFMERSSRLIAEYSQSLIAAEEQILRQSGFDISKTSSVLLHKNGLDIFQKRDKIKYLSKRKTEKTDDQIKLTKNQLARNIKTLFPLKESDLSEQEKELLKINLLIDNHKYKLNQLKQFIKLSNPQNILKKGFSISRQNGRAVTHISHLKTEEILETEFFDGRIESKIIKQKDNE